MFWFVVLQGLGAVFGSAPLQPDADTLAGRNTTQTSSHTESIQDIWRPADTAADNTARDSTRKNAGRRSCWFILLCCGYSDSSSRLCEAMLCNILSLVSGNTCLTAHGTLHVRLCLQVTSWKG